MKEFTDEKRKPPIQCLNTLISYLFGPGLTHDIVLREEICGADQKENFHLCTYLYI